MLISIIIRTLNEERYLEELLEGVQNQRKVNFDIEVVIVDSGSTDSTLSIAKRFNARITYIKKEDFTFGRSLNYGCKFAKGDILVFVSGHCIPVDECWVSNLVDPILREKAVYTYGRQLARDNTKFSEQRLFDKYYPQYSKVPQEGFFINNANAALAKSAWLEVQFDEQLTGLEDMWLAKELVARGYTTAYSAKAAVYHIHNETWKQVRVRYERESLALQKIMPEVHFTLWDFIKYLPLSIVQDCKVALRQKVFFKEIESILLFRIMYYWGTYRGSHIHKKLSQEAKFRYFYPTDVEKHYYD